MKTITTFKCDECWDGGCTLTVTDAYRPPKKCIYGGKLGKWSVLKPVEPKKVIVEILDNFYLRPFFKVCGIESDTFSFKGNCIRGAHRFMKRLGISNYEIREVE